MTKQSCPGFDPKPQEIPCPNCGKMVEFWKDDAAHTCPACGVTINNPQHLSAPVEEDLPRRDAVEV